MTLSLVQLEGTYGIVRLPHDAPVPAWVAGAFTCIARTPDELSVICDRAAIPAARAGEAWCCFRLAGTFAFDVVGVIAEVASVLAGPA